MLIDSTKSGKTKCGKGVFNTSLNKKKYYQTLAEIGRPMAGLLSALARLLASLATSSHI